MDGLTTGQLAKQACVNVETIRFYERRGILKQPRRRRSGYRQYDPGIVRVIRFIKRAQELGFTLAEIEQLLQLSENSGRRTADVNSLAQVRHPTYGSQ
jgi:DNA-binding transcriptional MerR regulator